jgi:hypothetical protein
MLAHSAFRQGEIMSMGPAPQVWEDDGGQTTKKSDPERIADLENAVRQLKDELEKIKQAISEAIRKI